MTLVYDVRSPHPIPHVDKCHPGGGLSVEFSEAAAVAAGDGWEAQLCGIAVGVGSCAELGVAVVLAETKESIAIGHVGKLVGEGFRNSAQVGEGVVIEFVVGGVRGGGTRRGGEGCVWLEEERLADEGGGWGARHRTWGSWMVSR